MRIPYPLPLSIAPPERLPHTAKLFSNFLDFNTTLFACCSDTAVYESKQQKNPEPRLKNSRRPPPHPPHPPPPLVFRPCSLAAPQPRSSAAPQPGGLAPWQHRSPAALCLAAKLPCSIACFKLRSSISSFRYFPGSRKASLGDVRPAEISPLSAFAFQRLRLCLRLIPHLLDARGDVCGCGSHWHVLDVLLNHHVRFGSSFALQFLSTMPVRLPACLAAAVSLPCFSRAWSCDESESELLSHSHGILLLLAGVRGTWRRSWS
jgi:hypothetical protein